MIELYSNTPNKIHYFVTEEGDLVYADEFRAFLRSGNDDQSLRDSVAIELAYDLVEAGKYDIIVPQETITGKRLAQIDIEYELEPYGVIHETIQLGIAKRYIGYADINRILGEEYAVDWDTYDLVEQDIRLVIDAYCEQSFNSWEGVRRVRGTNAHIRLPERLESLEAVGVGQVYHPAIVATGFTLSDNNMSISNLDKQLSIQTFGGRPKLSYFNIKGVWGYSTVPNAVVQAAIALFKANLCDDKEYRNKYIKSMTNENTRIELRNEAFSGDTTGNAFADDILAPYKLLFVGVI